MIPRMDFFCDVAFSRSELLLRSKSLYHRIQPSESRDVSVIQVTKLSCLEKSKGISVFGKQFWDIPVWTTNGEKISLGWALTLIPKLSWGLCKVNLVCVRKAFVEVGSSCWGSTLNCRPATGKKEPGNSWACFLTLGTFCFTKLSCLPLKLCFLLFCFFGCLV